MDLLAPLPQGAERPCSAAHHIAHAVRRVADDRDDAIYCLWFVPEGEAEPLDFIAAPRA
jgi:hypothetical protein